MLLQVNLPPFRSRSLSSKELMIQLNISECLLPWKVLFFFGAESLKSPPMKFQQSKTILVHFSPSDLPPCLPPSSLLAPPSQHQVTNPLHTSLPAPPAGCSTPAPATSSSRAACTNPNAGCRRRRASLRAGPFLPHPIMHGLRGHGTLRPRRRCAPLSPYLHLPEVCI